MGGGVGATPAGGILHNTGSDGSGAGGGLRDAGVGGGLENAVLGGGTNKGTTVLDDIDGAETATGTACVPEVELAVSTVVLAVVLVLLLPDPLRVPLAMLDDIDDVEVDVEVGSKPTPRILEI